MILKKLAPDLPTEQIGLIKVGTVFLWDNVPCIKVQNHGSDLDSSFCLVFKLTNNCLIDICRHVYVTPLPKAELHY